MAKDDKKVGLLIGIGAPKETEESDDLGSPGELAAEALIKAVKGGKAADVWAAFQEMLAEADDGLDDEETEEPAEDELDI